MNHCQLDGAADAKSEFLIENLRPVLSLDVKKGLLPFVQRSSSRVGHSHAGETAITKLRGGAGRTDFGKSIQLQPFPMAIVVRTRITQAAEWNEWSMERTPKGFG